MIEDIDLKMALDPETSNKVLGKAKGHILYLFRGDDQDLSTVSDFAGNLKDFRVDLVDIET